LSLIISLTFLSVFCTHAFITEEGTFYNPITAVTTTVYGRTMTVDPGSHQRIIDVAGKLNLSTGVLPRSVIFSACYSGAATSDGIADYDWNTNQISFVSNGAFNGAVFTADMTNNVILPPSSFYLNPVVFLGYDGVSQRRVIAGVNTPGKNFIFFEKPNFGDVQLYAIPSTLPVTGNDAYDGKTGNYYTVTGASLVTWNVVANTTSSFTLTCIPPNSFLSGAILVNPLDPTILFGVLDTGDDYNLTSINLSAKTCMVVGAFPMLPPVPRIIIGTEIAPLSGNIAISVTSDDYNAVIIYDQTLKLVAQVHTEDVVEDIFIAEANTVILE